MTEKQNVKQAATKISISRSAIEEYFPLFPKWIKTTLGRIMSFIIAERKIIKMYWDDSWEKIVEKLLKKNKLSLSGTQALQNAIPDKGPFIVVMNHPLGVLDSIMLFYQVRQVRNDAVVMANEYMAFWPYANETMLTVNNNSGITSKKQVRALHHHLEQGKGLLILPSGKIARGAYANPIEEPWDKSFIRLAKAHDVPIIPVNLIGKNRRRFYQFNRISELLSGITLLRETMAFKNKTMNFRVGTSFYVGEGGENDQQKACDVRQLVLGIGEGKEYHFEWMRKNPQKKK